MDRLPGVMSIERRFIDELPADCVWEGSGGDLKAFMEVGKNGMKNEAKK